MNTEIVVIPDGTTGIGPMILDANLFRWMEKKDPDFPGEYSLCQYSHIGKLVIPASVDIPHDDRYSPFASYKQRGFVWNYPTEWKAVRIDSIENHSPHLVVEDGVLYSADKSRLIYCFEQKTSFVVPQTVSVIEPFALCGQKRLKQIVMHDGIASVCDAAFMACSKLQEVEIPKYIKEIPCDCFDGCTSLKKVVLPNGLECIRNCAFRQCKSLKQIDLPDTLKEVNSFEGCSSLREIEIPAGVEEISGFLFCDSLRKVVLHEGVRRIGSYAFRYCNHLKEINFPEGLECIGARAFYPASLSRLLFPASLKKIESEAFYHNNRLRSIEFKSKVENIDLAAFACCPFLFKGGISKPEDMNFADNVFVEDPGLDKYGFWD